MLFFSSLYCIYSNFRFKQKLELERKNNNDRKIKILNEKKKTFIRSNAFRFLKSNP